MAEWLKAEYKCNALVYVPPDDIIPPESTIPCEWSHNGLFNGFLGLDEIDAPTKGALIRHHNGTVHPKTKVDGHSEYTVHLEDGTTRQVIAHRNTVYAVRQSDDS